MSERHQGKDQEVLASRKLVLEAAKKANPNRWSGQVRNCNPVGPTTLNPEKLKEEMSLENAA